MDRTKAQIKGSLYLSLESVSSRMSRLGKTELCFDRITTPEEVIEKISKVTLADVKEIAERLFNLNNFTLTTIGPGELGFDFKEILANSGL
jgi:predicted Zn-dependent peptidase